MSIKNKLNFLCILIAFITGGQLAFSQAIVVPPDLKPGMPLNGVAITPPSLPDIGGNGNQAQNHPKSVHRKQIVVKSQQAATCKLKFNQRKLDSDEQVVSIEFFPKNCYDLVSVVGDDWIDLLPERDGKYIEVKLSNNKTEESRVAVLKVISKSGKTQEINIKQDGSPGHMPDSANSDAKK